MARPMSEMTYRELVAEARDKVKLTLTEAEAAWLLRYLTQTYPRHPETNEGVARSGTHLCNGADICVIAGGMSADRRPGRGAGKTATLKVLRAAERILLRTEGPGWRLV